MDKNQFKLHDSKHAPFKILEKDKQFFVTIGNAILCSIAFAKKTEAEAYLATKPYELIFNAACFIMENAQKVKEHEKK